MKVKAMIPLVLGLAVGIATVKLALNTIKKARANSQQAVPVMAVRPRADIGAYKIITKEMVELVQTTENLFAPAGDRVEDLETVLGRVTAKTIPQNTAVLRSMLAPEGTTPGMVGRIPSGFRAVSVRIDEVTGVAYQITPGDWVDVIVVMDISNSVRGGRDTIAEVILQHVQVAAIGYSTDVGVRPGPGKIKPAKSATLLVLEADVPKLHLAATHGKITLAMRGDEDGTSDNPPFANMGDLIAALRSNETQPRPEQLIEPEVELPYRVIVYHGVAGEQAAKRVERITFEHERSSKIVDVKFGPPTRAAAMKSLKRAKRERDRRNVRDPAEFYDDS